jgi:hypothetical protein
MKKLLLILLCVPLIGLGQDYGCIEGDCENGYGTYIYYYDEQYKMLEKLDLHLKTFSLFMSDSEDGDEYVGEWKNGKFHGQGTMTFINGIKYVGKFKDGMPHGQGILYERYLSQEDLSESYVGEWKDGNQHGQGSDTSVDGSGYVGEWKDGKKHGQGTFTSTNWDLLYLGGIDISEEEYVGEWKDDKEDGQGTWTYADGSKYVGEWKDGKFHGQGIYTFPEKELKIALDSSIYWGKWILRDLYDIYTNASKYVGEWKDGKFHGQGYLTLLDGTVQKGIWENGEFIGN